MNYGLVLISHAVDKTFTDESGKEYNQIVPTLGNKPRNIVARMCDIIGYSRAIQNEDGTTTTKLFMRGTPHSLRSPLLTTMYCSPRWWTPDV